MNDHVPSPGSRTEITAATWHDFNALRSLEKACFEEDAWPFWDVIGVLTFPDVVRLKAVVDHKLVGFIAGDERHSKNLAWVVTFAILPAYQRQGIGGTLLAACEEQIELPTIRLSVRRSNEAAISLYKKHGYCQVTVWPKYYIGKEDALILEKSSEHTR